VHDLKYFKHAIICELITVGGPCLHVGDIVWRCFHGQCVVVDGILLVHTEHGVNTGLGRHFRTFLLLGLTQAKNSVLFH
jgi:hypothetical protein